MRTPLKTIVRANIIRPLHTRPLPILPILFIGANKDNRHLKSVSIWAFFIALVIGVQTITSCSGDDGGGATCGGVSYDPGKYSCDGDVLSGTCGGKAYNPEYQKCENNEVQAGAEIPPSGGGGGLSNKDPQIYKLVDGTPFTGSGILKIRLSASYDNNGVYSETVINAGSVTNGIVKLNLPEKIPDERLCYPEELFCVFAFYEVDEEDEGCNVSPRDAKVYEEDDLRLYDSNEKLIGELFGGHYHDDDGNEYFPAYLYSTKAAKITCDNKFKKIDIDAKAGWNKVYIKDPDSPYCKDGPNGEEVCKAIVSTNNFFTKEVKWTIETD